MEGRCTVETAAHQRERHGARYSIAAAVLPVVPICLFLLWYWTGEDRLMFYVWVYGLPAGGIAAIALAAVAQHMSAAVGKSRVYLGLLVVFGVVAGAVEFFGGLMLVVAVHQLSQSP
jgi:hypothetical protein